MLQRIALYLSIIATGIVLGANVYNSVVDAPNWGAKIPDSLETAKNYFAIGDPGTFFRVASPLAQILTLIALIVCWRAGSGVRKYAAAALALTVLGDVMTFLYFYPRNAIMFAETIDVPAAMQAWRGWSSMNHVRSVIIVAAVFSQLTALSRFENSHSRTS